MAYRRRRLTTRRLGRTYTRVRRTKSPKHGSRYATGFLGRVFNTNWLFGRNRHRRSV